MNEPEPIFREEVYTYLCKLAHRQLGNRRAGIQTLNTHALVHETFLKLSGPSALNIQDEQHFFALAARAMRQIIMITPVPNLLKDAVVGSRLSPWIWVAPKRSPFIKTPINCWL